jgi:hypothetical protein
MCADSDSQDRPAQISPDPKGLGEIVVTREMIEAGVASTYGVLFDELSDADARILVKAVYQAMAAASAALPTSCGQIQQT